MTEGQNPDGLRPLLPPWVALANLISQTIETSFASIPSLPWIAS